MVDEEPCRIKTKRPTLFRRWKERVMQEIQTSDEAPPPPPPPLSSDYQLKTPRLRKKSIPTDV